MVDIGKEGYDLSSELFSFKEMRRGIIEHGKTCYIKGYDKHAELFNSFLVKNGYFSKAELEKVLEVFEQFKDKGPDLTLETVEKYLKLHDIFIKDGQKWVKPENLGLNGVQRTIFEKYTQLTDEVCTLRIQKPRQQGVTTILEIIAQIEAANGKKVFYGGYDGSKLKNIKNLTYANIKGDFPDAYIINKSYRKKYDLIIIDEIRNFKLPFNVFNSINHLLTEHGRAILVGTPLESNISDYPTMKEFFDTEYDDTIDYHIPPTIKEYEKAEKYPEYRNEILGKFID